MDMKCPGYEMPLYEMSGYEMSGYEMSGYEMSAHLHNTLFPELDMKTSIFSDHRANMNYNISTWVGWAG